MYYYGPHEGSLKDRPHDPQANLVVVLTMNHCDLERADHQHSLHKGTILFRDPILEPKCATSMVGSYVSLSVSLSVHLGL